MTAIANKTIIAFDKDGQVVGVQHGYETYVLPSVTQLDILKTEIKGDEIGRGENQETGDAFRRYVITKGTGASKSWFFLDISKNRENTIGYYNERFFFTSLKNLIEYIAPGFFKKVEKQALPFLEGSRPIGEHMEYPNKN